MFFFKKRSLEHLRRLFVVLLESQSFNGPSEIEPSTIGIDTKGVRYRMKSY